MPDQPEIEEDKAANLVWWCNGCNRPAKSYPSFLDAACSTCRQTVDKCLDLALSGEDGMPDACCADCEHPNASSDEVAS